MTEELFPKLITLPRKNGEEEKIVAQVTEDGLFAIHRSIGNGYAHLWTITHVPSLQAITDILVTEQLAIKMLPTLRGLPWEWQRSDPQYFKSVFRESPFSVRDYIRAGGAA